MYIGVKIVWAVIAASLIFLVLLHSPKGDGLGGMGGQAQLFSSTKSAETTLNRLTWALTVLFLGLTVILSAGWLPNSSTKPVSLFDTPSEMASEVQTMPDLPASLEAPAIPE
jgi:preprotein translocase subunit SecG